MSLRDFQSYQLSLQFYRSVERFRCPAHLRSQLLRAASSVTLNLAEGSGKATVVDQRRFYRISLGSLRECEAVLELCANSASSELRVLVDRLGAMIYRLCHPR